MSNRTYWIAAGLGLLIGTAASADLLRFATYNIQNVGYQGISEQRADAIDDIMSSIAADVWAIQEIYEVDNFQAFLNERFGGLYETVIVDGNSSYRVGILSKHPIVSYVDHSDDRAEDGSKIFSRNALEVTLDVGGGELVTVISTHLMPGYDRLRRHLEGQRLAEIIGSLPADRQVVVMGDFNDVFSSEWDPLPSPVNLVQDAGLTAVPARNAVSHSTATFSSTTPVVRYDYIFMSGQLYSQLIQHEVYSGSNAAAASDHLPVWAEVDVAIPEPASAVLWMTGTFTAIMFRRRQRC